MRRCTHACDLSHFGWQKTVLQWGGMARRVPACDRHNEACGPVAALHGGAAWHRARRRYCGGRGATGRPADSHFAERLTRDRTRCHQLSRVAENEGGCAHGELWTHSSEQEKPEAPGCDWEQGIRLDWCTGLDWGDVHAARCEDFAFERFDALDLDADAVAHGLTTPRARTPLRIFAP